MATWQTFEEEPKNITVLAASYRDGYASFTFQFAHEISEFANGKWKALVDTFTTNIPPAEVPLSEFVTMIQNRFKAWRAKLDREKAVRDAVEGYIGECWNIV